MSKQRSWLDYPAEIIDFARVLDDAGAFYDEGLGEAAGKCIEYFEAPSKWRREHEMWEKLGSPQKVKSRDPNYDVWRQWEDFITFETDPFAEDDDDE